MLVYHQSFVAHPPLGSAVFSPTAYRLGFGSPTRLVRFGFVGETASSTGDDSDASSPFMEDGAWYRQYLEGLRLTIQRQEHQQRDTTI